jgi:PAS domain S-box-containing protein
MTSGALPAVTMTLATVVAHVLLRTPPTRVVFNTGQMALAASTGVLVFRALGPGPSILSARSIVAAVVAALGHNVVSSLALAGVFERLDGRSTADTLRSVWRVNSVTLVGNTSFGLVLAVVATVDPVATLLASTLLIGLYLGYRGYSTAIEGQRRAESMTAMTRQLLDFSSVEHAMPRVLGRLTEVFTSSSGEVVLATGGFVRRWHLSDAELAVETLEELPSSGHLGLALSRAQGLVLNDFKGLPDGASEALVAPIGRADRAVGVVGLLGKRGLERWDETDADLLAAFASELAIAVENVELFHQVERERSRLQSETTKLGDILGAASDGITLIGASGAIASWNPAMERITGVPEIEAVGHPWYVVLRLRDESGTDLLPGQEHALTGALSGERHETPVNMQILRRNGDWRWLQCTTAPIAPHGDEPGGIVLVARDVTAERELDALKADFISTVSHELRTPLTPLKGFLATMKQRADDLTPEQLLTVNDAMNTQLTRLETLIADLLAVAELEHGRFDVHAESVDLAESVPVAVDVECSATGGASDRCRMIVREPVIAVADPVALVRSVRALVSNAIKHTQGAIEVTIDGDDEWAYVVVRDEGPGIASWDQQRIFGRFERLGDHLRRTQGPGLGLTIARSLAHRMGGEITLESDVAGGSAFTLQLPRARPRPVLQGVAREA